jgi:hypothetical protein
MVRVRRSWKGKVRDDVKCNSRRERKGGRGAALLSGNVNNRNVFRL